MKLYIYRVYQKEKGTVCVWEGPVTERGLLLSHPVRELLEKHIIIPKDAPTLKFVAERLAEEQWDDAAMMVESYLGSSHHNPVPELGIGLALDKQKWTDRWPQYEWEVLKKDEIIFGGWRAVIGPETKWSISQLKIQRKKRSRMPIGCPLDLWESLTTERTDLGPNRPKRSKSSAITKKRGKR